MKCLCPCPPLSHPPPTSSPLSSPEGSAGGRIKQCSQGMAAKQKPEKKKKTVWAADKQWEGKEGGRSLKTGGKGRGRDKEINAEMRKDAFRSPQVLSDRQGHTDTNKHTHTVCSAGFSVCAGSRSVVITQATRARLPTLFAETQHRKIWCHVCILTSVCVWDAFSPTLFKQR